MVIVLLVHEVRDLIGDELYPPPLYQRMRLKERERATAQWTPTCDRDLLCVDQGKAADASKGPEPDVMRCIAVVFKFCKCSNVRGVRDGFVLADAKAALTLEHEAVAGIDSATLALFERRFTAGP